MSNTPYALVLVLLVLFPLTDACADSPLDRSRSLTSVFAERLQSELKSALEDGGPIAAVDVCKKQAPLIASALSRISGAKVRRISLRLRNPANAPDAWEAQMLREFDRRAAQDETPPFEATTGTDRYRYLLAIPTAPLCLVCHGSSLTPEVQQLLDTEYPHDLATGYEAGDIRGAFSITWPSPKPQRLP